MESRDGSVKNALERGTITFCGYEVLVEPGVLVPRKVSEVLVTVARQLFDDDAPVSAVDMGTGSGNVGVAIAHALPKSRVYSTDVAERAVRLAEKNAKKHGLEHRMTAHVGDMFGALDGLGLRGKVDVVVCSPPFISSGRLQKDRAFLLDHEPREAFDAGPYGLSIHQRLVRESLDHLRPHGWIVLEFGEGQLAQVQRLLDRTQGYEQMQTFEGPEGFINCIAARRK